jgi:hypothetical protein
VTNANDKLPFWFDSYVRGAAAEDIARAEEHIGWPLPEAYKRLLLEKDGGVSNYDYRVGDRSQDSSKASSHER